MKEQVSNLGEKSVKLMYFVSINYYKEHCMHRLILLESCFMSNHHKHPEIPHYSLIIQIVIAKKLEQMGFSTL